MDFLLILPILIPLATAVALLLALKFRRWQHRLSVLGAASLLVVAVLLLERVWRMGIQVAQIGDWPAPFGITLVADLFSAIMIVLAGLMGLAVAIYSTVNIDRERVHHGYCPLLHFLLMGVCGAFLTGDVFNLYVWFEVMLIASFVLLSLGGERAQLEGSIKYVSLNLMSSAIFLAAVGITYGMTGTLNMADLAVQLKESSRPVLVNTLAILYLLAFGIKAAVFPLFFWLPASYHTPPVAVSAIFAGLLTKVGVYAMIRFFTLLFTQDTGFTHSLILIIAGFTMVTGVLGAAAQNEFRRILSFHIVSQIGYMIMGLGLLTPLALAGSVFYIIHHIIVKTNLFLVSGVVARHLGGFRLDALGGLYAQRAVLSILFLVPALSLAGIPPLSGFWAKFMLVKGGLETGHYVIVAAALMVGLLTLFSMTKIWNEAFWRAPAPASNAAPSPERATLTRRESFGLFLPIVALALLTVSIGLIGQPVYTLAERAADQLLDPDAYIHAVMEGRP